jgi:hypothetical protein
MVLDESTKVEPDNVVDDEAEVEMGTEAGFGRCATAIPMLPVKVSNNPPTEDEEVATTSGSDVSPDIRSPIACATINALQSRQLYADPSIHDSDIRSCYIFNCY